MRVYNIEDMIGGWFVGNFEKTAYKANFEVAYKVHKQGDVWDSHYHKEATEINFLIRGMMTINNQCLLPGDIFVIEPYYISNPEFRTDCELIVVKTKSVPGDKYVI